MLHGHTMLDESGYEIRLSLDLSVVCDVTIDMDLGFSPSAFSAPSRIRRMTARLAALGKGLEHVGLHAEIGCARAS